jgi:hypothetical protein
MSEVHLHHFQFNPAVFVRDASPRLTADAGALLLRELDHKLGVASHLADRIYDPRDPAKIRYEDTVLLRQWLYARALGHARQDDADRLAHDPAFRVAAWNRPGDRPLDERLASQPSASRLLARLANPDIPGNLEALRDSLAHSIRAHQQAHSSARVRFGVVDTDSFPIEVHGKQPGAAYHGYYKKTIYSPLVACFCACGDFNAPRLGDGFLHATLRKGNAAPASGAAHFLRRASAHAHELAVTVCHRLDAGFADAKLFNLIDGMGDRFVCRLPHNAVLDRLAEPYLNRPAHRPPKNGYFKAIELSGYRNPKWKRSYRVVLVVVDEPLADGRLDFGPRFFFLVTNLSAEPFDASALLELYRKRGTFEDRLGEWNGLRVNLSQDTFRKNEATLLLSLLAFNLAEALRGEMESARDPRERPPATTEEGGWDMERFRRVVLRSGARVLKGGRRLWFDVADGVAPLWRALLERLGRLRPLAGARGAARRGYVPPPEHAFLRMTYRM